MTKQQRLDRLTGKLTGFSNFEDMLNAGGRYRPSMPISDEEYGKDFLILADAYDKAMEKRGDERRTFRY